MEKQKVTVRVAGRALPLTSSDSPEHLNRVAAYVDRRISELIFTTKLPREIASVLAALNMADELMKQQDENTRLRTELALLRARQGESL